MCKPQSPSPQGQIEGEEVPCVRPRYLSLGILGKRMLVVDLGVTRISMGVASVPGSAVHLVFVDVEEGEASAGKASSPQ